MPSEASPGPAGGGRVRCSLSGLVKSNLAPRPSSPASPGGHIHLTLCGNQPKTWGVAEHAERLGLRIVQCRPTTTHSCFFPPGAPPLPLDDPGARLDGAHAWGARRKFRSGALGSKHWCGKFGYEHRRCEGDADMRVSATASMRPILRSRKLLPRTPTATSPSSRWTTLSRFSSRLDCHHRRTSRSRSRSHSCSRSRSTGSNRSTGGSEDHIAAQ